MSYFEHAAARFRDISPRVQRAESGFSKTQTFLSKINKLPPALQLPFLMDYCY